MVAAYVPFLTVYALFLHANVGWSFGPLRYFIASPTFHRWHHTTQAEGLDTKFAGLFPFWDLLFGTFHMRRAASLVFGVTAGGPDGPPRPARLPLQKPAAR